MLAVDYKSEQIFTQPLQKKLFDVTFKEGFSLVCKFTKKCFCFSLSWDFPLDHAKVEKFVSMVLIYE